LRRGAATGALAARARVRAALVAGVVAGVLAGVLGGTLGCGGGDGGGPVLPDAGPTELTLERVARTDTVPGCAMAGPLAVRSRGETFVMSVADDGFIRAYDPATGVEAWSLQLAAPDGYDANITAPPVLFDEQHVVIAYQHMRPGGSASDRVAHLVTVLDLETRALDPSFAELVLSARVPASDGSGDVDFLPSNAFSRAALAHASVPDRTRGLVYVSFGNIRDIQPWHGWVFELDLDRWHDAGAAAAVSGVLLTTPEASCGTPGASGSDGMICGGGVWAPSGPKVWPAPGRPGGFELVVPTGNGQLDVTRHDFANTLIRAERGLAFEPGCDATACAGFDVHAPAAACIESCNDLFVPRLRAEDAPPRPASGVCDGLSLLDCYGRLDWDLGADSPARVEIPGGPTAVALPAKDGAVYLFDEAHFGTLFDRRQVAEVCGTATDTCTAQWAGMMMTEPAVATVAGQPVVMVVTHMFDGSHPAGIVALRVALRPDGTPTLEPFWTAPDAGTDEALLHFRHTPGRLALLDFEGEPYALAIDVGERALLAMAYLVRVSDGAVAARATLDGNGQRFAAPLVLDGHVWVSSCEAPDNGAGHLEAYAPQRTGSPGI